MAKPESDFSDTETLKWEQIEGAPGQYEKILAKDSDIGAYTRLILSQADLDDAIRNYGSPKNEELIHEDLWEEVYAFRGTLIDTSLNQTFREGYFACRPPRMKHGPFFHPTSAISYEVKVPEDLWNKPELEFFDTEVLPWEEVEGSSGEYGKVLAEDKDTIGLTRLVLHEPDLDASIRDYHSPKSRKFIDEDKWTEIMVLRGSIIDPDANETYVRGYYACFSPGTEYGPYFYPTGVLWIETKYPPLKG